MDGSTDELRRAHDTIAELYAGRLADALDRMPIERAVLGLFCDLVLESGDSTRIGDIGCGSGRLAPFVAARGLEPHGVDLSPEMVRVARRDHPAFPSRSLTYGTCRSPTPRSAVSSAGTR